MASLTVLILSAVRLATILTMPNIIGIVEKVEIKEYPVSTKSNGTVSRYMSYITVRYTYNNKVYSAMFTENSNLITGTRVNIRVNPKDPRDCILANGTWYVVIVVLMSILAMLAIVIENNQKKRYISKEGRKKSRAT